MKNQISNDNFVAESILKIGSISEVKGKNIIVRVDKNKNAPHLIFDGKIIKNVSVGSYVKIAKGYNEIIGKIEGEFISEDKDLDTNNYTNHKNKIKRFLNVTLVGYIESNIFKQGLNELPLIDNDCFLLSDLEFNCIHSFAKIDDDKIKLGYLLNETNTPIELGVDKLFASHIGIFGNTGSGKSYTLSKVYYELLNKYKTNSKFKENAKFIVIDFNGEYAIDVENDNIIVGKEFKNRFFLSTSKIDKDKFPIPESEVNDLTFWSILLKATEQTQKPFLNSSLFKKSLVEYTKTEAGIKALIYNTISTILTQGGKQLDKDFHIFFLDEFIRLNSHTAIFPNIRNIRNKIKSGLKVEFGFYILENISGKDNSTEFLQRLKEIIDTLVVDLAKFNAFIKIRLQIVINYFDVITKGYYSKEHIGPLYNRLEAKFNEITKVFAVTNEDKIITNKKPVVIINLNDVNVEMKKIIPLVICKYYYEYFKNNNLDREKYLNIIVDEAHNILSRNSIRESETWKDYRLETFEEIIKEGRKFGVFLTISSQRPYDISDTIISQLHNYLLHRLINNKDIEAIGRTVSYLDKISFDSLSILPQGGCILAGLSADLPVVMKIDKLPDDNKPHNETIVLTSKWK
ncbi:ATP-binding protein [Myroides odoratus]|uniref:Type IV secretory pathway, VirB4 components n=1 Tax=Myroides odoratus TaxID=256 RepID=A0A378RK78_MYROD|nr:ATP-binding protein [Myroides odoratus]QQU05052.1 ATP-binding protein [Myroides odoratus]STZ27473.1 Type IV secretory pathway, VirB4 components [Myroides odoratus]